MNKGNKMYPSKIWGNRNSTRKGWGKKFASKHIRNQAKREIRQQM